MGTTLMSLLNLIVVVLPTLLIIEELMMVGRESG
jgi:hypothetical protein